MNEAIHICNKNIQRAIIEPEISLNKFIAEQDEQFLFVEEFIIDFTCISDSRFVMSRTLNKFRQEHSGIRIIILASGREKDKLLSDLVDLGIYDIVTSRGEQLLKDLCYCLKEGMTYKDCVQYKIDPIENQLANTVLNTKVKEKVVIRNEVTVNKALIGFIGTHERIGVTHHAILSAFFLKDKGFKIAVVENKNMTNLTFNNINESYAIEPSDTGENYFTLNLVDFYPAFDLNNLYKILAKNYNFIIIDFGMFYKEYLAELNRCIIPVIVCGSKPWEAELLDRVFESTTQDILKEFYYLFNYTDLTKAEYLIKNMAELSKVYIADMTPDPFNSQNTPTMTKIFKNYLPSEKDEKERGLSKWLKEFQKKVTI